MILFNSTVTNHNSHKPRHNSSGSNIIVEDIMMNDDRNGSVYICIICLKHHPHQILRVIQLPYMLLVSIYNGLKKPMILILAIYYIHTYTYLCTHLSNKTKIHTNNYEYIFKTYVLICDWICENQPDTHKNLNSFF